MRRGTRTRPPEEANRCGDDIRPPGTLLEGGGSVHDVAAGTLAAPDKRMRLV